MIMICLVAFAFGKLSTGLQRRACVDRSKCPLVFARAYDQRGPINVTDSFQCFDCGGTGSCAGAETGSRSISRRSRAVLQTASAPSSEPAATINVASLPATEAIALLCSRNITSVAYAQALFDYYDDGGFACLSSFITLNRTQVSFIQA